MLAFTKHTNVSEEFVSSHVWKHLIRAFPSIPEGFNTILEHFEPAVSPAMCVESLGMSTHPKAAAACDASGKLECHFPHGAACAIIYNTSLASQFKDRVSPFQPRGGPGGGDDGPPKDGDGRFDGDHKGAVGNPKDCDDGDGEDGSGEFER